VGSLVTLFSAVSSLLRTVMTTMGAYLLATRTHKLKQAQSELKDIKDVKKIKSKRDAVSTSDKRKRMRDNLTND